MRAVLKNELYRAFCNKKMLMVFLIETVFVIMYTVMKVYPVCVKTVPFELSTLYQQKHVFYLSGALHEWIAMRHSSYSTVLFTVLPLLSAIPFGASLYLDEKNKYVYQLHLRCSKKWYYKSKLLVLFLSGGTVAVYPFALSLLINMAMLPVDHVMLSSGAFPAGLMVFAQVFYKNVMAFAVLYLLELFLMFGLLNCFCFIGAYLFNNQVVVMLFPFAVFFSSGVLGNFVDNYVVPWSYVKMYNMYRDRLWIIALQIIVFIIILFAVYWYQSYRKADSL